MPRIAYVNGRYVPHTDAAVHIEDRGYQFADGVYEVVACIDGVLADERGHLDRLERSLSELKIAMPLPRRTLSLVLREVLRRNRARNAAVYIQVTRGVWKRDFTFPPAGTKPALVVTARPADFTKNPRLRNGIKAFTVPDIRWRRRDIKTVGLLAQVLAKQQSAGQGGGEALLVDEDGFITEGASSNFWIVTADGTLVTRPATHYILKGVTRSAIAALGDIKIEERPFTPAEAYKAKEAFTSSAVVLIAPVVEIDGHKIGDGRPGPVTLRLYDAYRDYVRQHREQVAWKA